jgi:hypothetical protein
VNYHWNYVCHLDLATFFFWWGLIGPLVVIASYIHVASRSEPWKPKRNLKINFDLKSYLENHINFSASWFLRVVSKFWVSTLFRNLMQFPTTLIFRVFPDLASIRHKFQNREITPFRSNRNFQQHPPDFQRSLLLDQLSDESMLIFAGMVSKLSTTFVQHVSQICIVWGQHRV